MLKQYVAIITRKLCIFKHNLFAYKSISHLQRLNGGKPLGTDCCEWLWSIAIWTNRTLPYKNCLFWDIYYWIKL